MVKKKKTKQQKTPQNPEKTSNPPPPSYMVAMLDTGGGARVQVQPCKVPSASGKRGHLLRGCGSSGSGSGLHPPTPPSPPSSRVSHTRFAPESNPAPSDAGTGEGSGLCIAQEAHSEEGEGGEGRRSCGRPGARCGSDGEN